MKAKIRQILEECIQNGIWHGYERAHKYADEPNQCDLIDEIEYQIWLEIDERFDFENLETQINRPLQLGHYCPDFDFLWVAIDDPKMECCTCKVKNLVEEPKDDNDVVNGIKRKKKNT